MRSQRQSHGHKYDLVEELVGDEAENHLTHKPSGKYEILNDIGILSDAWISTFIADGGGGFCSGGSWAQPQ